MKVRSGFVSNSSSSSFICDYCGADESGWDIGLNEAGMYQCEHGHILCEDHFDESVLTMVGELEDLQSREEYDEWVKTKTKDVREDLNNYFDQYTYFTADEMRYELPACFCPLCNFDVIGDNDLVKYLQKQTGVTSAEVLAHVKLNNKRRRKVRTHEVIDYCCDKLNTTENLIIKKLLEEYSSLEEFYEKTGI